MQKDPEAAAAGRAAAAVLGLRRRPRRRGAGRRGAGFEAAAQVVCADADEVLAAIAGDRRPSRRAGLRHRRRGRAAARAGGVRGRGFNSAEPRGAIAFKYPPEEKLTKLLPSSGRSARSAASRRGRGSSPCSSAASTVENITLAQPAADPRARPADRRHGRGRAARRRDPVRGRSIPRTATAPSRRSSRRRLPVLRVRAGDPRHREERWCLNLQCPAQATRRLMHWASRPRPTWRAWRRLDREARRRRAPERRSDFYVTAEQLLGDERMGEVSARNMVTRSSPPRAWAAPGADRPGDPDGLRGHRPSGCAWPATSGSRTSRPPRRRSWWRSATSARRSPRASSPSSPARGRRGDRGGCASTASTSTSGRGPAESTSPPRATRRSRARRSSITGAFTDPRRREDQPPGRDPARRTGRRDGGLVGVGQHGLPAGRGERGASKTAKADKLGVAVVDQDSCGAGWPTPAWPSAAAGRRACCRPGP